MTLLEGRIEAIAVPGVAATETNMERGCTRSPGGSASPGHTKILSNTWVGIANNTLRIILFIRYIGFVN